MILTNAINNFGVKVVALYINVIYLRNVNSSYHKDVFTMHENCGKLKNKERMFFLSWWRFISDFQATDDFVNNKNNALMKKQGVWKGD